MPAQVISILFTFLFCTQAQALQCQQIFSSPKIDVYTRVRHVLPMHTSSKDLSLKQKQSLRKLSHEIEQMSQRFQKEFNKKLTPYGANFLPRLRLKLRQISDAYRENNQLIINEIQRYINDKGDLRFRELELLPQIRQARASLAHSFLEKPESLHFGLEYFLTTRQQPGYRWPKPPKELGHKTGRHVGVIKPLNTFLDEAFPFSQTPVAKEILSDGLPFSGLPLTPQVFDFFKKFGDQNGELHIEFSHSTTEAYTFWGQMGLSSKTRPQNLPLMDSRWSSDLNTFLPVLNENGQRLHTLADASLYAYEQGYLFVPTLPGYLKTEGSGPFKRNKKISLVSQHSQAEFSIPPTHQELLTALMELIYRSSY